MDPGRSFSGAVRAVARSEPGQVRTVGPLGGSWSAEDPAAFVAVGQERVGLDDDDLPTVLDHPRDHRDSSGAGGKEVPRGARPRALRAVQGGASVQILPIGSYGPPCPMLHLRPLLPPLEQVVATLGP